MRSKPQAGEGGPWWKRAGSSEHVAITAAFFCRNHKILGLKPPLPPSCTPFMLLGDPISTHEQDFALAEGRSQVSVTAMVAEQSKQGARAKKARLTKVRFLGVTVVSALTMVCLDIWTG